MGSKRYLYWNDAVHGFTNYRFDIDYNLSSTRSLASNFDIWAIEQKLLQKAINLAIKLIVI